MAHMCLLLGIRRRRRCTFAFAARRRPKHSRLLVTLSTMAHVVAYDWKRNYYHTDNPGQHAADIQTIAATLQTTPMCSCCRCLHCHCLPDFQIEIERDKFCAVQVSEENELSPSSTNAKENNLHECE